MQRLPQDELREALSLIRRDGEIDNQTAIRLKKKLAEEFREQLSVGIPTNEDEAGLRKLAEQIKSTEGSRQTVSPASSACQVVLALPA